MGRLLPEGWSITEGSWPIKGSGGVRLYDVVDGDGREGIAKVFQGEGEMERAVSELARLERMGPHPNIPAVLASEFRPGESRASLVMEVARGPSAAQIEQSDESIPGPLARRALAGMLSALEQAHAAGVVHGDIRPDNVVFTGPLDDEGTTVLLVDWEDRSELPSDVRRASFFSPERASGDGASESDDLWAAALVATQLVVGFLVIPNERRRLTQIYGSALESGVINGTHPLTIALTHGIQDRGLQMVLRRMLQLDEGFRLGSARLAAYMLRVVDMAPDKRDGKRESPEAIIARVSEIAAQSRLDEAAREWESWATGVQFDAEPAAPVFMADFTRDVLSTVEPVLSQLLIGHTPGVRASCIGVISWALDSYEKSVVVEESEATSLYELASFARRALSLCEVAQAVVARADEGLAEDITAMQPFSDPRIELARLGMAIQAEFVASRGRNEYAMRALADAALEFGRSRLGAEGEALALGWRAMALRAWMPIDERIDAHAVGINFKTRPGERAWSMNQAALALMWRRWEGDPSAALDLALEALELSDSVGLEARFVEAAATALGAAWSAGLASEGTYTRLADILASNLNLAFVYFREAVHAVGRGDYAGALVLIEHAVDGAERARSVNTWAPSRALADAILAHMGQEPLGSAMFQGQDVESRIADPMALAEWGALAHMGIGLPEVVRTRLLSGLQERARERGVDTRVPMDVLSVADVARALTEEDPRGARGVLFGGLASRGVFRWPVE